MKKFLFFCAALLVATVAFATNKTISPSSAESDVNFRAEINGSVDTIYLTGGLYVIDDQVKLKRNVTVIAVKGEKPILQPIYYCEWTKGAKVTFDGVAFDGSRSKQQAVRVYDATAGKELRLYNCEFYNHEKDVISCDKDAYMMDSCIIDGCYFHNNKYCAVYCKNSSVVGQQTIYGLKVTNSTFANNDPSKEYRALIDVQSQNREATDDITVLVDHCTFYNNTVLNYDYSAIRTRIVNKTTVSNCIFAHPTAEEWYATNVWAGTVTHCLAANFNKGYMAGPTLTEAKTGDPKFKDAANSDFTLGTGSDALAAGTDGSNLGDPRWWPAAPSLEPKTFYDASEFTAGEVWSAAEWNITRNADKTLTFVVEWTGDVVGMVPQVKIGTGGFTNMATEGKKGTLSTTDTYEDDVDLAVELYLAYAGGACSFPFTYKVGSSNEKPATPVQKITVTFANDDAAVEGAVPAAIEIEKGQTIKIPVNRTLYKDGYTLTAWTDGGINFAIGTNYGPTKSVTLKPIFSANPAALLSATSEVTVKWAFEEGVDGTPSMHLEGGVGNGFLVAQSEGDLNIDVKLTIDATAGKFYNVGRGANWCQVNNGTKFSFPSKAGAVVEVRAYNEPSASTVLDGQAKTGWASNVATFAAAPTAGVSLFDTEDANQYLAYLKVTLPATVKYYVKNNWGRGDWDWKEMTQDGAVYKLENVQFGGAGFNYNTKADADGQAWLAVGDEKLIGTFDEMDVVNLVLDPAAGTITVTVVTEYVSTLPDGYYLVGMINGVNAWDYADLSAEKLFAENTEVPGEYMLDYNFAAGDEIKVINLYRDDYKAWYNDGGGNFVITSELAGDVTIYFRPAGNSDWGYFYFTVVKKSATGIDNTAIEANVVKVIENGQLIIIKNGVKFNAQGAVVR